MLKSFKEIAQKVSEISKSSEKDTKSIMAPIDSLESNIEPGDILSFRYKRGYGNGKTVDGFYICLSAKVAGGTDSVTYSPLGNLLYGGFEIDGALPETLMIIINSIYKSRRVEVGPPMNSQIAKRMLSRLIGVGQYKTFDTKYISIKYKVDFDVIDQQVDELFSDEQELE